MEVEGRGLRIKCLLGCGLLSFVLGFLRNSHLFGFKAGFLGQDSLLLGEADLFHLREEVAIADSTESVNRGTHILRRSPVALKSKLSSYARVHRITPDIDNISILELIPEFGRSVRNMGKSTSVHGLRNPACSEPTNTSMHVIFFVDDEFIWR